jgi:hypothetical protein
MPICFLAGVLNYLDRTNLNFAALQLNAELGFTPQASRVALHAALHLLCCSMLRICIHAPLLQLQAYYGRARVDCGWSSCTTRLTGCWPDQFQACSCCWVSQDAQPG